MLNIRDKSDYLNLNSFKESVICIVVDNLNIRILLEVSLVFSPIICETITTLLLTKDATRSCPCFLSWYYMIVHTLFIKVKVLSISFYRYLCFL